MALQCTSHTFTKTIVNVRPDWRSTENSSLVETFFQQKCKFIPCNFMKKNSTTGIIWHGFCKIPSLIFWKTFFEVSLLFFYRGCYNSTERTRTSQLGLDIYNCVTGNVYIWMPMSMLLPMPRCQCRYFQIAFYQFFGDQLFCRTFKWLLLNIQRLDLLCLHEFFYHFHRG